MASGAIGGGDEAAGTAKGAANGATEAKKELFKVRALRSQAQEIVQETVVSARTIPDREAQIRSEVTGQVERIGAERGAFVREGELIAALDLRDRQARLQMAQASLEQARLQAEAAQRLSEQGLQSAAQTASAVSAMEAARAALTQAQLEFDRAQVKAPFDGWLVERGVEQGDYIGPGDMVARVVDLSPIVLQAFLTEQEMVGVHVGAEAHAKLATGEELTGTIRFVSPAAEQVSRMFRIEMEAPNQDGHIRAGVTATLSVPHDSVLAHHVSPAHLMLSDEGEIGLLTADAEGNTSFETVQIIKTEADGVWVTGLPEEAIIVTLGKDFVRPGDKVAVVFAESGNPETAGTVTSEAAGIATAIN